MKTASAYILYQPLSVSLSLEVAGGSLNQNRNGLTGEYEPDRSLFPLVLRPRLMITDPDGLLDQGDHSSDLVDTRWYIGSDESGEMITSQTDGFTLGTYGTLTVKRNVAPDQPVNLFFSCAFIDPRTGKTFRKTCVTTLSSVSSVQFNLSLEIDAALKMAVSPFRNNQTRKITATMHNGSDIVADTDAVYLWQVRDGASFRSITADDLFYVSGQNTKTLTIDRRFIDKETIRVMAYHKSHQEQKLYAQTRVFRWYGQWDERETIERGRFIRPDTSEIEVRAVIDTPKGQVTSPADYYDITHIKTTNEAGARQDVIGYGERVVLPATQVNRKDAVTVFGIDVKELTALRACTVGGKIALVNGKIMTIRIPKE